MPDSPKMANIKKQWDGVPTISSNSVDPAGLTTVQADTEEKMNELVSSVKHCMDACNNCSICDNKARLVCAGCHGLPGYLGHEKMTRRYCSKKCQEVDWESHKKDCKSAKARQRLFRAANLTKALFYIYQETSFTWGHFEKVEKHGQERVVFLNQEKSDNRKSLLVPFSTVTDIVPDPEEQEAFLTHLSCNEAVGNFGPIFCRIMKGTIRSVKESKLSPKNSLIEITQGMKIFNNINFNRMDGWEHVTLRVTLFNEEEYVVDFSGAQYGHREECVPFNDYCERRVERINETVKCGSAMQYLINYSEDRGDPYSRLRALNDSFVERLMIYVDGWVLEGGSVESLLRLLEKEYEEKKKSLLETVKANMIKHRDDSIRKTEVIHTVAFERLTIALWNG